MPRARAMRSRFSRLTEPGSVASRLTVLSDTPARSATCFMVSPRSLRQATRFWPMSRAARWTGSGVGVAIRVKRQIWGLIWLCTPDMSYYKSRRLSNDGDLLLTRVAAPRRGLLHRRQRLHIRSDRRCGTERRGRRASSFSMARASRRRRVRRRGFVEVATGPYSSFATTKSGGSAAAISGSS